MSNSNLIFISHSGNDRELAVSLCDFLEKKGLNCWIAPRNIPAGKNYGEAILEGIRLSPVMVVIFSKAADRSAHIRNEVERAFNLRAGIILFRTEAVVPGPSLEYFLSSTQWLDAFAGRPSDHFEKLYRDCLELFSVPILPEPKRNVQKKYRWYKIAVPVICILSLGLIYFIQGKNIPVTTKTAQLSETPPKPKDTIQVKIPVTKDSITHNPGINNSALIEPAKKARVSESTRLVLESIDGKVYEQSTSADRLNFFGTKDNSIEFGGRTGIYRINGRMKLVGHTLQVIEGNVSGAITLYEDNTVIKGSLTINKSKAFHDINLQLVQ